MPPKKQTKQTKQTKKISFEEDIKNKKTKNNADIKNIFQEQKNTENTNQIKKKGGAKDGSEDSESISSSESDSESDVVMEEEHFDEIEDDDALENDNEIDDEEEKSESDNDEDEDNDDGNNDDGDDCMYRFSGKKSSLGEDDDIDEGEYYFEEDEKLLQDIFVPNDKRITRPTLTKYERVRVLGERAKQISLNAKPMIKGVENLDPKEIAKLELKMGVLPMIIIRPLPTGQKEKWKVNELKIVN